MDWGLLAVGSALAFAGIGSAIGTGSAGMAAAGAWKRCYQQNKPAPFLLLVFVGAPLTQTIYGFLLMNQIIAAAEANGEPALMLGFGVIGGIAIGMSAMFQGKAGAVASDALADTGKGFVNFLLALGIIESVALLVMAFGLISL